VRELRAWFTRCKTFPHHCRHRVIAGPALRVLLRDVVYSCSWVIVALLRTLWAEIMKLPTFRISTVRPDFGIQFIQFVIKDDEPS
jgi:hypothetical protein